MTIGLSLANQIFAIFAQHFVVKRLINYQGVHSA